MCGRGQILVFALRKQNRRLDRCVFTAIHDTWGLSFTAVATVAAVLLWAVTAADIDAAALCWRAKLCRPTGLLCLHSIRMLTRISRIDDIPGSI